MNTQRLVSMINLHKLLLVSAFIPTAAFAQTDDLNSMQVEQQKFEAAYEQGLSGKGISVGILDDGVDYRFSGMEASIDFKLSRDFGLVDGNPRNLLHDSYTSHGTKVASTIVADGEVKGFAPGVNLVVLRGDRRVGTTQFSDITEHSKAIRYAGEIGLKLVNRSYSLVQNAEFTEAVSSFAATGGLLINSAGNEGLRSTPVFGVTDENRASWIFVGSVELSRSNAVRLTSYSNAAGNQIKDRYIVAFGNVYAEQGNNEGVGPVEGTSFAAPTVAAAAALVLEKWPYLSGQTVGQILLDSATDLGKPGVDDVFGHGLLNVESALKPIGSLRLVTKYDRLISAGPIARVTIQAPMVSLDKYNRTFGGITSVSSNRQKRDRVSFLYGMQTSGDWSIGTDELVNEYVRSFTFVGYKNFMAGENGFGIKAGPLKAYYLNESGVWNSPDRGNLSLGKRTEHFLLNGRVEQKINDFSIAFSATIGLSKIKRSEQSHVNVSNLLTSAWSIDIGTSAFRIGVTQRPYIERGYLTAFGEEYAISGTRRIQPYGSITFGDASLKFRNDTISFMYRSAI